jgi:hypothetical protein
MSVPLRSSMHPPNDGRIMKKRISRKNADQNLAIRVRVSPDGAAEIEVNQNMWDDPDIWGTLLSDVAVSIAEGYVKGDKKKQFIETLEKSFTRDIRDAIQSELSTPF